VAPKRQCAETSLGAANTSVCATLVRLGQEMRSAAIRRDYAGVERLAPMIGTAVEAQVRALPAGDARRSELAAWVRELWESTETMLRVGRAAQAEELRRMPFVRTYLRQQSLSNL